MRKKIKKEETPQKEEVFQKEKTPKGREEFYFFPDKGKTIKATSLEEALERLNASEIR